MILPTPPPPETTNTTASTSPKMACTDTMNSRTSWQSTDDSSRNRLFLWCPPLPYGPANSSHYWFHIMVVSWSASLTSTVQDFFIILIVFWSFHCQWLPSIPLSVITLCAKNKMIRYSSSDNGGIWDTNLVIIVCVPVPNIQFILTEKCCSSLCRGKGTSPWICCSSFPTSTPSIICFLATSVHV